MIDEERTLELFGYTSDQLGQYSRKLVVAVCGGDIQAHHIHPVRDNINTLRIFDVDNGITLCTECHRETFGNEYDYINEFENIVENGGV